MTTTDGNKTTDRQAIADIFASFYEELYKLKQHEEQPTNNHEEQALNHDDTNIDTKKPTTIPDFTFDELNTTIKQLHNGRCKDDSGLIAEMVKEGGETLKMHILRLFNDIVQPNATPPTTWKPTTITIIHKSGDPTLPQNYRPISISPLLYKIFSADYESDHSNYFLSFTIDVG